MSGEGTMINGYSDFHARVEMNRPKYNALQNRLADYLIDNEHRVLEKNIYEIASENDTSVATVTRFCQMIGYTGLADMKFHIQQQEVAFVNREFGITRNDDINILKNKVLQYSQSVVHDCIIHLDNDEVERAVEALGNADTILFTAIGSAGGICRTGVGLFLSAGLNALMMPDGLMTLRKAAALQAGDVLVTISYDGFAKETGDAMMLAREAGAFVIFITSAPDSLLAKYADVILKTPARSPGNAMSITVTTNCQIQILQVLLLAVMTKYNEKLEKTSQKRMQITTMERYSPKEKAIRVGKVRITDEK